MGLVGDAIIAQLGSIIGLMSGETQQQQLVSEISALMRGVVRGKLKESEFLRSVLAPFKTLCDHTRVLAIQLNEYSKIGQPWWELDRINIQARLKEAERYAFDVLHAIENPGLDCGLRGWHMYAAAASLLLRTYQTEGQQSPSACEVSKNKVRSELDMRLVRHHETMVQILRDDVGRLFSELEKIGDADGFYVDILLYPVLSFNYGIPFEALRVQKLPECRINPNASYLWEADYPRGNGCWYYTDEWIHSSTAGPLGKWFDMPTGDWRIRYNINTGTARERRLEAAVRRNELIFYVWSLVHESHIKPFEDILLEWLRCVTTVRPVLLRASSGDLVCCAQKESYGGRGQLHLCELPVEPPSLQHLSEHGYSNSLANLGHSINNEPQGPVSLRHLYWASQVPNAVFKLFQDPSSGGSILQGHDGMYVSVEYLDDYRDLSLYGELAANKNWFKSWESFELERHGDKFALKNTANNETRYVSWIHLPIDCDNTPYRLIASATTVAEHELFEIVEL